MDTTRRGRILAVAAASFLLLGTALAIGGDVVAAVDFATAALSFQVPNLMLGLPAGICGVLLMWHRVDNRLGWLLTGAGTSIVVSATMVPLQVAALDHRWSLDAQRTITTIYTSWVLCQFLFLPLAVLFFPDGRLPGARWRAAVWFVGVTFVVELLRFGSGDSALETVPRFEGVYAPSWLDTRLFRSLGPAPALELLDYVVIFSAIWVRYRRGNEKVRRQLLWLLWAMVVAVAMIVLDVTVVASHGGYTILVLGLLGLVPVAMTWAVLRYEVLDIRLVWSRTVAWSLLTAAVFGVYFLVVATIDPLVRGVISSSAPAAVVVAAFFHPARMRLQRWVDARMYGDRADPLRAATSVTAQLTAPVATPVDVLEPIRSALRLPYAELRAGGEVLGTRGAPTTLTESIPLVHAGMELGELVIGVRVGQRSLDRSDRSVLSLLAAPIALAIHTTWLNEEVRRGAEAVSRASAAERSRLRRDLHDGLGPLLTGIALHADAAANVVASAPEGVAPLLASIRATADSAIGEVRVLLDQLRPTSLEELGLVPAIEHHAGRLSQRSDGSHLAVVVEAADLPAFSPGLETTIYRVVTEALTNAARHSRAERVDVELEYAEGIVTISVQDDGGESGSWAPGVGLHSMAERVRQVGGEFSAGPTRVGGQVRATLPTEVPA